MDGSSFSALLSDTQTDRRDDILRRILERVCKDPLTDCWNWTGPTSGEGRGGGYGRMSVSGQTCAVHLVMFTHFHGYIPG